jgi:hypothetical protein
MNCFFIQRYSELSSFKLFFCGWNEVQPLFDFPSEMDAIFAKTISAQPPSPLSEENEIESLINDCSTYLVHQKCL